MNILTELNENERKIKEYYVIKKKIDNYKYHNNIPRNVQINPLLNYDIYKKLYISCNLEKKIAKININDLHKKHEELLMKYITNY